VERDSSSLFPNEFTPQGGIVSIIIRGEAGETAAAVELLQRNAGLRRFNGIGRSASFSIFNLFAAFSHAGAYSSVS